ncbi:hypothetical protein FSP39_016290 [Pinctada imbricata]|uniref:Uncharacterized protein n=1 Tax=Pinctada imbricata TaxID=66713 RepID=A0AA88YR21_PINIB|nr:hypothetical protein FSP39_016290 [Pinctada imbricata]
MLPNMSELSYEDRLRKLKLPTLKFRRLQGDMIETFKITTGVYHPRQDVWNQLPESIINAKNVKTFESRLDRHWGNHPMIYNYEAEYNVKIHHQEPQQDFTPEETDVELNTEGLPTPCFQRGLR